MSEPAADPAQGLDPAVVQRWIELNRPAAEIDLFDMGKGAPAWISTAARLIRPICVGALMAIPTVGSFSVGLVAAISPERGKAMAEASVMFLRGIPWEIVMLIGALATGYGFAKTIELLKGKGK